MRARKMRVKLTMRLILIVIISTVCSTVTAQTWDEWFKQRRTQRRYLLTQIAELKIYAGLLQKGYTVVSDGLKMVSDIKNGEFNLHNAFFTSLTQINPAILQYSHVAEIVILQTSIYKRCKTVLQQTRSTSLFKRSELELFDKTFAGLIDEVTVTVDELIRITTANKLEMTDDQRIKRIDLLKSIVTDQFISLQHLEQDIFSVARARAVEQGEINLMRQLYTE
jgi:hypothetical protein